MAEATVATVPPRIPNTEQDATGGGGGGSPMQKREATRTGLLV